MTNDERKAVLLLEMRLAGVPLPVINYYKKYLFGLNPSGDYVGQCEVSRMLDSYKAGEGFASWLHHYGHHFEDADNLPTDDSWTQRPKA